MTAGLTPSKKAVCGMRFKCGLGLTGSVLLLNLLCLGQARNLPPHIRPNSQIVQTDSPVSRDCGKADWALLDTSEAKNLLSGYEFDGFIPRQCKAVDVKWLPTAQIVRLNAGVADDDYREITLLRASTGSRLWLIPIEKGMVGFPGTPSDPHNLAAFNDLLRVAQFRVTDDNLPEVSDLYQFLVRMEVNPNPHQPMTFKNALSISDFAASIEHKDGFTDFTL